LKSRSILPILAALALFALIGKRFAPRLRNLKDRKFHTFEKADVYPALANHIGVPINTALILEHWDDLLHLAASITTHSVAPSTILKKLAASSKPSQLAKALRELGRIERSLFMIEWYSSRRFAGGVRRVSTRANPRTSSSAPSFTNAVKSATGSFESQAFRASGLNLVVSAIVHWNTVYPSRVVAHLRQNGRNIPTLCSSTFRRSAGSTSISPASTPGTANRRCPKASDRYVCPEKSCARLSSCCVRA
jgi:TnpA family transposase